MGIPRGNTVALAGDPGTGKTTFLLTFFRYGHQVVDDGICLGSSRPQSDETANEDTNSQILEASLAACATFDKLIHPTIGSNRDNAPENYPPGTDSKKQDEWSTDKGTLH